MEKDEHAGGSSVRLFAESKSLSRDAIEVVSPSWRMGTEKTFHSHVERFAKFCRERYTDPIQTTIEIGIEFLTEYFKTGAGYSSVNFAPSTLSSIIKQVCNVPFGKSSVVCRLLKGVLILGQPYQDMLPLGMLLKNLLLSSQNQLLQIVI